MKKVVQINTVCYGSTGKIMKKLHEEYIDKGYDSYSFYGRGDGFSNLNCEKFGGFISFWFHVIITTIFDSQGYGSYFKTKKMVNRLREINPDIIHLHNIHGYYLHFPTLFNYLKNEYNGEIKWTLHDCFTFTGHCAYFSYCKCNKWKKGCYKCPNKKKYPISLFFDNSKRNYINKKKMFTGLKNVTLITPSLWLKGLVLKSFLKEYNIEVINNEIDNYVFKKTIDEYVKEKYNISNNKKIILGVANIWEERKGFNDFFKLRKLLNNDYEIVLVGVNKKQMNLLKKNNIVGITKTNNQVDLAKLYSISDYFVNPTYEDNYPTVNLEAMSCGCFVICYDTGGSKEQINNKFGTIIPPGNIKKIRDIIYSRN